MGSGHGHDHSHSHSHSHDHAVQNIKTAFFLNFGFTLFELIGGLWVNSVSILSDALHDLGDSISLGLSWYLESYSKRQSDTFFSYGYRRYSLLSAVISGLVLLVGSAYILSIAIPRVFNPEPVKVAGMFGLAVIGVAVNLAAFLRLKKGDSHNEKMIAWHFIEDVMGWGAILFVSVILFFFDLPVLDPILSVLISLWIIYGVVKRLKSTLLVFLQAVPQDIGLDEIEERLTQIPKVKGMHHLHLWSLDGKHHVLTAHVIVDSEISKEQAWQIKQDVKSEFRKLGISHVTLEIEWSDEDCAESGV